MAIVGEGGVGSCLEGGVYGLRMAHQCRGGEGGAQGPADAVDEAPIVGYEAADDRDAVPERGLDQGPPTECTQGRVVPPFRKSTLTSSK